MNYRLLAQEILKQVGGSSNITQLTNCATRLRMNFKNEKLVNLEALKKIPDVLDAIYKSGQYQIIIGTDVANVCREIQKIGNIKDTTAPSEQKTGAVNKLMDIFASIFTPVIPAITAAGMIKAILVVCAMLGMSKDSSSYIFLNFIADAGFYFLPIMLGFSTARKLGCNPYLAAMLGGVLLHPNFITIVKAGNPIALFTIPVKLVNYASSVIPIVLAVCLMNYVERLVDKISPKPIKFFTKPVLTILIMAPLTLTVLGPLGSIIGDGIAAVANYLLLHVSWLVSTLMGAFMPLLVLAGMHWSFLPILLTSYSTYGYEAIMGPGSLVSNICQGSAALCIAIKTKNADLKQLASSAGITALMGITEPAMYGVNLRLKKPLIAVMIGGASGGFYAGITGVVRYTSGTPGLLSLPIFIGKNPMNIVHACIAAAIGFVVTFILTWFIMDFEAPVTDSAAQAPQLAPNTENKPAALQQKLTVYSPLNGKAEKLSSVNDETIANEIMGKGIAIVPTEGKLVAPFDGKVAVVFETGHAIGLRSNDGMEFLIHIGIDTVELNGKYFTPRVMKDDLFKKGDLLIEFDQKAIEAAGFDCTTSLIVTNSADYRDVVPLKANDAVEKGNPILVIS
jgi:PTS system beta-glucosides-specific IIC component